MTNGTTVPAGRVRLELTIHADQQGRLQSVVETVAKQVAAGYLTGGGEQGLGKDDWPMVEYTYTIQHGPDREPTA